MPTLTGTPSGDAGSSPVQNDAPMYNKNPCISFLNNILTETSCCGNILRGVAVLLCIRQKLCIRRKQCAPSSDMQKKAALLRRQPLSAYGPHQALTY